MVKDLNAGLLDFPAIMNNEEVYLCWRLGEERIRFWHRQDEGFAARKPIEPGDTGPTIPSSKRRNRGTASGSARVSGQLQ